MATELKDTPALWSIKGNRVYGLDTPWLEGSKASESAIHYPNEEILRVSIKGFVLDLRRRHFKGKVAVLRVDQRKVAIRLLHSLLGWNEMYLLLIDLDSVLLLPCTRARTANFECMLQESHNSKPYRFDFETMQDLFEFQEFFTGFRAQILIPDATVSLQAKGHKSPAVRRSDVQLWRKVPNRSESLVHTHDGLRTPSQLPETGAKRDLLEHGKYPTQIHTTTASNEGLVSVNDSVMKRHASSLLVFSGYGFEMLAFMIRVPIDGRISIAKWGPRSIRLVEDGAKTSYISRSKPFASIAHRSSATTSGAAGLIALESTANIQASRLSEIDNSISRELDRVDLLFDKRGDDTAFMAVFDALKDAHELFGEVETHGYFESFGERASLTRVFESAVIDADGRIPPAKQTSANPELTPLHEAKAGQVDSSAPLSQPQRGLAGDSTNHPDGRADMIPLVAGSLDSKSRSRRGLAGNSTIHPDGKADIVPLVVGSLGSSMEFHGRNRSSDVPDDGQQESTKPPVEGVSGHKDWLNFALNEYISSKEDSRLTSMLAGRSHLIEYNGARHLESTAAAAESWRTSTRANITDPDAVSARAFGCSSDSVESESSGMAIKDADPNLRSVDRPLPPISLQCPFHFLGCKEEFYHGRKEEWVKHSLTHFQIQKSRRGARQVRRVEPPNFYRCYSCKTQFSGLSGTACWKDYMDHIHNCGLNGRIPIDLTLVDYLWQEGIMTSETYRDLKIMRHLPPPFETNMSQASALIKSKSSGSSISETSRSEKQVSTSETQIDREIWQASVGTSAKQEQWRRRICRKIILFMLWKREQDVCLPTEFWSSPASFDFITILEISRFDKIKGIFETYSGREWDWWPFDLPAKPLESRKVRIRWRCTCGDQRWTDASRYLARKCQAFVNENTTGHERGNVTSQPSGSTASHSQLGSVVPGSFPSDTSQPAGNTSNIRSSAQASHIQNIHKSPHSKELYVLLCIYQGSQVLHSQILASKCQNDEAFFENLRQEYRRLRGFFRFWFSPLQFSHCDFVKFTRFYVNELAKVGHSLPIDLLYQYNPRPPGPHEDPPISPHEFRRRFYTHLINPCGRDEALERIPKRQKRFQVNLHVDGREDMWGLHVELQPSFLIVLMWQIAITAGGWAFMGWWLSSHKGDLQNAAVPVSLIVMAVMALWAPISKGMTEAL